jgi:hypothetical protein
MNRFERSSFSHVDVVNSLLLVEESLIARTRDRSQDAKNIREKRIAIQEENERRKMINRRTREIEAFTHRESSNFERVKAEMTIIHNEDVASKIQNVLHRADSASRRERERERERARERARERRRVSIIAVEREENFISAVDESAVDESAVNEEERRSERERERERERSRERGRRDQGQAASK